MPEARDTASPASSTAIGRALAFLDRGPFASGEIVVTTRARGDERTDRSLFAAALAAGALARSADARVARFRERAAALLLADRETGGLWRFWPRGHPRRDDLPPDLDDTAAAALALRAAGIDPGLERRCLLAQRDVAGRFFTWFVPRTFVARLVGPVAAQRRFASPRHPFWSASEAAPGDVDAGANARLLELLGADRAGDGAARWLVGLCRSGGEREADKWYRSAWMVRYLVVRALAAGAAALAPAATAIGAALARERDELAARADPLELALAISTARRLGMDGAVAAPLCDRLLKAQLADGSFPRSPAWYGGPKRSVDWGSRELTTAFAIEALDGGLRELSG